MIIAGHQQITKEWWSKRRDAFNVFISQFVIDEAKAGDLRAARERTKAIKAFPLLDITPDVEMLATGLLTSRVIPRKSATDAAHIAIAAVHGMDFLMTWNCVHLANAIIARSVAKVCKQHGFECPVICTPEELLGE